MNEDKSISKYTMECIMLYQFRTLRAVIIALVISIVATVFTILGCLWYMSLPVEETATEISQEQDGEANTMIGIDNSGIETED